MSHDIEFLRLLGNDLRALGAAPESPAPSEQHRPRWLWPAVAAAVVAAALLAAFHLPLGAGGDARSHPADQAAGQPPHDGPRLGPAPMPKGTVLDAVSAVARDDVWAVGHEFLRSAPSSRSVVLHWNGRSWTSMPHPAVRALAAVAAISPSDVWAVGEDKVVHFNGSRWTVTPTPHVDGMFFRSIAAVSADDIWIAGQKYGAHWTDKYGERNVGWSTVALHWDGRSWSVVPTPNPGARNNDVQGLVAVGPDNAWIVGYYNDNHPQTMTLHWDGRVWRRVPSPDPGRDFNVLWGAGVDGGGTVWALGHYGPPNGHFHALYMRWASGTWTVVPPPPGGAMRQTPTALAGASGDDVFAVGSEPTSSLLIAHWDGAHWTSETSDVEGDLRGGSTMLNDVAVVDANDAWAVGQYEPDSRGRRNPGIEPVVLHWDGTGWRRVSTE